MRKWLLLLLVVAGFLLSTTVALANNSWANYHWGRTSNPFTLKVVDSTTPSWDGYRGQASADWTASSVLDLAAEAGSDSKDTRKKCRAVFGKVRACNTEYGFNGWLGLAQVWVYSNGHIAQGVVKVNDSYFNTSTYNNPNAKRHVICQEVGHTLGLDHQTGVSCMDDRNGLFDPTYVSPNAHDYAQLETIYAHLDSSSTVAASSTSSARGASDDDDDEFGRAIEDEKDSKGRTNKFVKDLGKGQKLVTSVTWAD